jgi:hypothetical protein
MSVVKEAKGLGRPESQRERKYSEVELFTFTAI